MILCLNKFSCAVSRLYEISELDISFSCEVYKYELNSVLPYI
jgi:hypothetical protein